VVVEVPDDDVSTRLGSVGESACIRP
jgi:hypothetical protein